MFTTHFEGEKKKIRDRVCDLDACASKKSALFGFIVGGGKKNSMA